MHEGPALKSWVKKVVYQIFLHGEFDPGSELTLVVCLSHASRTRKLPSGDEYSGERVSNTWATCPRVGDNTSNEVLIPNDKASL